MFMTASPRLQTMLKLVLPAISHLAYHPTPAPVVSLGFRLVLLLVPPYCDCPRMIDLVDEPKQTVSIALNSLLRKYRFEAAPPPPGDKYAYDIGEVVMRRKPVHIRITPL
jgi:hypothetical protein